MHPVEPVVELMHDAPRDEEHPRRRPCGGVAHVASLSYLMKLIAGQAQIGICNACRRRVNLDDVTGEEPYTPLYRAPAGCL